MRNIKAWNGPKPLWASSWKVLVGWPKAHLWPCHARILNWTSELLKHITKQSRDECKKKSMSCTRYGLGHKTWAEGCIRLRYHVHKQGNNNREGENRTERTWAHLLPSSRSKDPLLFLLPSSSYFPSLLSLIPLELYTKPVIWQARTMTIDLQSYSKFYGRWFRLGTSRHGRLRTRLELFIVEPADV